ncbi:type II toxin-antitoxin system death-on-curing family toxin [Loigolactobacillus binensis]|uniref:Type II toxin-antitoxin system death-on-curing family toxin n=1 Tax=Loigolactobacillus binensis TaxID=2559922 RepID=A0ABW3E7N6_9LACO|nr:type II toxin-antitoxin system death-on-curing family toxin [Loigolactobacillus binensis]
MRYLTETELIAINTSILVKHDQQPLVRNPAGLQSLIRLPQQAFFDQENYRGLAQKIGIVFIKIINLHPFQDGNKRTAVIAATVIAKLNRHQLTFSEQEMFDLALFVAKTDDPQLNYAEIYGRFEQHLTQDLT